LLKDFCVGNPGILVSGYSMVNSCCVSGCITG